MKDAQFNGSEAAALLLGPFPEGRTSLYVQEVAGLFRCTAQHVSDLIEEGKLEAIDIASGRVVWDGLITELAGELQVGRATIRQALKRARQSLKPSRRYWRVPRAAYIEFLTRNHSVHHCALVGLSTAA